MMVNLVNHINAGRTQNSCITSGSLYNAKFYTSLKDAREIAGFCNDILNFTDKEIKICKVYMSAPVEISE